LTRSGWPSIFLALVLAGFVIVPVFAFIAGYALAGLYEGEYGVFGYLRAIYANVLAGEPAAALLVSGPAIVVLSWYLALRLRAWLMRDTPPGSG
jgi:hypothetical protein